MTGLILTSLVGAAISLVPPVVSDAAPPAIVMQPPFTAELPAPIVGGVPEVRAKANLPSLFSTDDYPSSARRLDQQGTVAFALAIDPAGRVTQCAITKGSGSPSLDFATCAIIQRRARFEPARDGAGRAVEDRKEGRIRWVLPPKPAIPYADHQMALVFTADAAGDVKACRSEASIEVPKPDEMCAAMMWQARNLFSAQGGPAMMSNRELVFEQGVRIGSAQRARTIGTGSGEKRASLFMLALEIDSAGAIVECGAAEGTEDESRVTEACADSVRRKFVPSEGATGVGPTRYAVRYFAHYTRPAQ